MQTQITTIERYLLESLMERSRELSSLRTETGLTDRVLINTLNSLFKKKLILKEKNSYLINKHNPLLSENKNTEKEVLVKTCINSSCHLNTSIYYIDPKEEKIFQSLLSNIENFLRDNKKKSTKMKDQMIFFWGKQNYLRAMTSLG